MKSLTLSIIIPAYNEETYLKNCLESIAQQTVKPSEVIVVDNNSTDKTAAVARSFPFVRVIAEPTQGMIAARNAGFRAAKGTVMGRIDADSRLSPDWVERIHTLFSDDTVQAATGPAYTMTINPEILPRTRLWSLVYFWATEAEFGIPVLWGANMAIRRSAWQAIQSDACLDDSMVHEDQDLSYLLAGKNLQVVRDNHLNMSTEGQSHHDWGKFSEYTRRRFRTRRYHKQRDTLQTSTLRYSIPKRLLLASYTALPSLLFIISSLVFVPIHLFHPPKHR